MWRDLHFKSFVDLATAGRQRGLSTTHMKHNVFPRNKFGPEIELHNPHIGLFKSSCEMMQVCTFNEFTGLGLELTDRCRHPGPVPYGPFSAWIVPMKRRLITLLYKHWIYSVKITFFPPVETYEIIGRSTHKISSPSKYSKYFRKNTETVCFSLAQKSLSGVSADA